MFVVIAMLIAVVLPFGVPAGRREALLTRHVPDAVARGLAPRIASAPALRTMDLAISLPSRNEAELRSLLAALYDPSSPIFRHYLSVAQFTDRYGPSLDDYTKLLRFALAHHLEPEEFSANRRVLDVRGTVSDVERAFAVTIGVYREPNEARTFFAPDREPTLDVALPVLHVAGLDDEDRPVSHFARSPQPAVVVNATGSGPDGNFIASDVRAAYYGGTALTGTGQSLGLFEFTGYNQSDVDAYFTAVGQKNHVPIVGVSLNGANLACTAPCKDDSEQVLDMQEALSMAPGLKQLVVYVGKHDVSIFNQMASDDTSAQLSCSWGFKPNEAELDPIFEEYAAQGQSMLIATGDDGYKLLKGVVWPADDALVTAVGGTDLKTSGPGGPRLAETGWRFSGGGPSPDGVAIPAYQIPFVTAQNGGSTTLRNVPDIAADGNTDNFSCYNGTCSTGNGGTSYAAPLWAGFIALANEHAASSGDARIGFLNPVVYALGARRDYAKAFYDETAGFNGEFYAGSGFDLVTGFGSPSSDATIEHLVRGR